ncbi:hypothetical protein B0H66DRAFT_602322 [Apodospora peruviana]|uniref:Cyanovirin-N domain-containing protein n=1 Tax=Apodospora peruviana TaxID=516989 RepID=A0AAE0M8K7_9PEZI|nr:hypothetical protein B0H66DRAFT_602322 [Apodospora peruviana]
MKASLALVLAPMGALAASLNCQTVAPLNVHCCASTSSEIVETVAPSNTVMLGCADDMGNGWFRNHAGFYAQTASLVDNCVMVENGVAVGTDSLPKCGIETHAAAGLTRNGTVQIAAACDAQCVTNGKAASTKRTVRMTLRNYGAAYHNTTGGFRRYVNGTHQY